MNNERRKQIDEAIALIEKAAELVRTIADEEQEYYDNMPESLQQGEKGERAEEAASNLSSAADELDYMLENLQSAKE